MNADAIRDDNHPVAAAFRAVLVEQIGRPHQVECVVDDDTDADRMVVSLTIVCGQGRIALSPLVLEGQASMSEEAWYREVRSEMRRWFRGVRKERGL